MTAYLSLNGQHIPILKGYWCNMLTAMCLLPILSTDGTDTFVAAQGDTEEDAVRALFAGVQKVNGLALLHFPNA